MESVIIVVWKNSKTTKKFTDRKTNAFRILIGFEHFTFEKTFIAIYAEFSYIREIFIFKGNF